MALSSQARGHPCEGDISRKQISRCEIMILKIFISSECAGEGLLYEAGIISKDLDKVFTID